MVFSNPGARNAMSLAMMADFPACRRRTHRSPTHRTDLGRRWDRTGSVPVAICATSAHTSWETALQKPCHEMGRATAQARRKSDGDRVCRRRSGPRWRCGAFAVGRLGDHGRVREDWIRPCAPRCLSRLGRGVAAGSTGGAIGGHDDSARAEVHARWRVGAWAGRWWPRWGCAGCRRVMAETNTGVTARGHWRMRSGSCGRGPSVDSDAERAVFRSLWGGAAHKAALDGRGTGSELLFVLLFIAVWPRPLRSDLLIRPHRGTWQGTDRLGWFTTVCSPMKCTCSLSR